ncbi:ATP-binding protein [Bacteriovoracaceae bacterium]|nr:ATP-binding protein [Bacteriovoracaceae bacterium]
MKKYNHNIIFYTFVGFLIGLIIPISFVYIDILQLDLAINFQNFLEVINSQNIYPVSFASFPVFFAVICNALVTIKTTSLKLKEKNQFVQKIMDSMDDIIMILDLRFKLIESNEGFHRFYTKFFAPYFSKEDLIELMNIQELLKNHQQKIQGVSITASSGEVCEFAVHIAQTKLNGQESFIVSMKSIDDILNKQKVIEDQRRQIENAARLSSLGEMAGGIAHEINNPLSIITGNAYRIKKEVKKIGVENEFINKYLNTIQETVKRMNSITTVLLNLSRNGDELQEEEIDANQLIEDVVHLSSLRIRDEGINLMISNNKIKSLFKLNRIKISQILVNLLNNSIDAISNFDSKWIELRVVETELKIKYYVIDCGEGIIPEVANRIFEPMYTTKDIGKGNGLGLSLSHTLAKDMGGDLRYENIEGNTSFVLEVPKVKTKVIDKSEDVA